MTDTTVLDAGTIEDIQRVLQLKQQKAEIEQELEYFQEQLAKSIEGSAAYEVDGKAYKVTIVRSETYDIDAEALERVDPDLYERVTKKVINTEAFKRAVTNGDVSTETALLTVKIKERKPWVKVTALGDAV